MKLTAIVTREGDWYAIEVPEIEGLYTQVRRLDQVEKMVTDAALLLLADHNPPGDFEITIEERN